jgi:large subunit ribosomal protein L24
MKIKKGDKIQVIQGKDKGREGVVKRVIPRENKVLVEGINIAKKHVKPRGENQKGGIIRVEKPLNVSKVMVICPACNQPTRVGYQIDKKGNKYRVCRKCESLISSQES